MNNNVKQLTVKLAVSLCVLSAPVISSVNTTLAMERPIPVMMNEVKNANEGPFNVFAKPIMQNVLTAEEALLKVKELITIPKELDSFNSHYQEDMFRVAWNFNWHSKNEDKGAVHVDVDARTGQILNYSSYDPREHSDKSYQSYLPKLSWEAGATIAKETALKFSGMDGTSYRLISKPQHPLYKGLKHYNYQFEQVVNGIPFKNQTIYISLNADSGTVRSYHFNWQSNLDTNQTNNTTKAAAEQIFKNEFGMELAYIVPFNNNRDQIDNVKLVYRPVKHHEFYVDATTGGLYKPNENIYFDRGAYGGGGMFTKEMADSRAIEEFEQKELDSLTKLLSQEDALAKAKTYMEIPSQYKHTYSHMSRSWDFPQNREWNFRWEFNQPSGDIHHHGSIDIAVNAETGKLVRLSHYHYPNDKEKVSEEQYVVKSEEQAVEIAKEFIKKHYPEHMNSLKQQSLEGYRVFEENQMPVNYNIHFQRMVNGIVFDRNNVGLNVNAKTGEVTFFQIMWADLDFPAVTNVVSADQILAKFLADNPIELQYMKFFNYRDQTLNSALLYTFSRLENQLYDAKTGIALDYTGAEKKSEAVPYKDIAGHWAESDINFLHKYKVLPFDGEAFDPNKSITQGEFIKILTKIERPYLENIVLRDVNQFVVDYGLSLGSNYADWNEGDLLTREDMAQLMIQFLNYQEVAKLDIFVLPFTDSQQIAPGRKGAVAIINGLGIMTGGSNNQFMPTKQATRAEAATTIVKLLKK